MSVEFEKHDHAACQDDGLAAVVGMCGTKGLQLTKVRFRVIQILLQEHRALGAYEILDILREEGLGSQPPVVYRALDFLIKNGFAHKVEKLNAYIACGHVGTDHIPAFLICRDCDVVAETKVELSDDVLSTAAQNTGFEIERVVLEAEGVCPKCSPSAK